MRLKRTLGMESSNRLMKFIFLSFNARYLFCLFVTVVHMSAEYRSRLIERAVFEVLPTADAGTPSSEVRALLLLQMHNINHLNSSFVH